MTGRESRGFSVAIFNWRDPWHPEGGGSELYVSEVARRLHEAGHRITIFCAHYPGARHREVIDGITYLRRGGHLTVYLWAALYLLTGRFGRLDRVLEVHNGVPFLARLFTRVPVTVLVHHVHREQWSILNPLLARFGWFLESTVAVRVNRGCSYLAVSDVTRTELIDLGVRGSDISLAWNGAPEIPEFVARPRWADPHLVVVTRLVPHKRVEHAMAAVAALRDRHPGLHLTVMGAGWWHDELLAHRRALGLEDAVTFAGFVSNEEKYAILSSGWVHLLPSVKEGWGLAIIEAAQVGVPSVAYASAGGVAESILDGVTGLLADGGATADPGDLIAKVDHLLSDADLCHDLGEKARVRATHLTWDHTAARVAESMGLA